jgi:hypothetical protein
VLKKTGSSIIFAWSDNVKIIDDSELRKLKNGYYVAGDGSGFLKPYQLVYLIQAV